MARAPAHAGTTRRFPLLTRRRTPLPNDSHPFTILAVATYFKGNAFLEEAKRQGARVFLLTAEPLRDEAWARTAIDEFFFLPGQGHDWSRDDLFKGAAHVARTRYIDRVVALDDFDLEKAAALREHLRLPGLGETQTRFFRDKLAMRMRAAEADVPVPDFAHVLNEERLQAFVERVPGPWVVKPRSQASAAGIKKAHSADELWRTIDGLGDEFSFYLVERFLPGAVYHVDSVVDGGAVAFARAHRYLDPPLQVMHGGGIFISTNLSDDDPDAQALFTLNQRVQTAMGLQRGVAHTEFIKSEADGRFYFLETAARVGGAYIAEALEASSGVNLWREWARLETRPADEAYTLPDVRHDYSGVIVTLARQEHPDLSAYDDPEIAYRIRKPHHAGLVVRSGSAERVEALLRSYQDRFYHDFHTSAPPPDRLT